MSSPPVLDVRRPAADDLPPRLFPVVSDDVLGAASGQKAFVVGAERSPR